ncbi:MAG TPA: hypothetical protein VF003_11930 [Pseudonocardiaceae bacterium]
MITSGGKRKPAKLDLDAGTLAGRRRINPACSLAVIRRCNSAHVINLVGYQVRRRSILEGLTSEYQIAA